MTDASRETNQRAKLGVNITATILESLEEDHQGGKHRSRDGDEQIADSSRSPFSS